MTLTIDLSPLEQSSLAAAARQEGVDPAALVKRIVAEHLPAYQIREEARVAAIQAARGSLAHLGVTVNDLHRERQADKAKEEMRGAGLNS